MSSPVITGIFPIPVYITKLNRKFTKQELNEVNIHKERHYKNTGNKTSLENYILDQKPFLKLKKELSLFVQDYFNKIICPKNITPYITQSWLNYTNAKEFHHMHEHPNSYISGVLYLNSNKEKDKIKFFRDNRYQQIKPEIKEYNFYNSLSWWFPVETGQVILFPSSLTHSVDIKEGDNTRISLAFNTFIRGEVGNDKELTKLTIL
jgi:uncharacterized protein (TIGR02466 family)